MQAEMGGIGDFRPKLVNGKLFGVSAIRREIGFAGEVMGGWVDGCGYLGSFMTKSQITGPQQYPATSTCVDP